jgi:uncharacterized protein YbjT (DUF2867 family)
VLAIVCSSNGYTARGLLRGLASLPLPKRVLWWRLTAGSANGPAVVPGLDAIRLDHQAPEHHAAALEGVSDLVVLPSFDSNLIAQQSALVAVAPSRGVQRVHVVSLNGADTQSPARCLRWLGQVERRALATKLPHTLLRCAPFMQNISLFLRRGDSASSLVGPFRHAAFPWIDAVDVGAILARLISEGAPSSSVEVQLNGPEDADFDTVALIMSRALGQPVTYTDVSNPEAQGRLEALGMPAARARAITEYWDYLVSGVVGPHPSDAAVQYLGRPLKRLNEFALEYSNESRAAA